MVECCENNDKEMNSGASLGQILLVLRETEESRKPLHLLSMYFECLHLLRTRDTALVRKVLSSRKTGVTVF